MHHANFKSWLIWFTAGLFYLFEFIHRVDISVMIPELMQSFNVSVAMLGGLSACYFYAYALAQIPVGLLIDRYGTRNLLTFACFLISIGSLIFATTSNIFVAGFCRVLIGFGSAFAFVGCLKLGATWFPKHKFSFIVGLTNLLGVTGAIIGGTPMAYAVEGYGWRPIMLISAGIGIILTALLAFIIEDQKKYFIGTNISAKLLHIVRIKKIWIVSVFGGLMVAPIAAYSELWGVSYLVNFYELDRPTAARITTITFVGIAIGGPTIGWLAGYLKRRKILMFGGATGALISISAILFTHNMPLILLYTLHFCFGLFTSSMLLCFSLNSETSTPNIRATTIALTNTIIMVAGASLQTICGELLNYSNLNYYIGFSPLFACYALAIFCLYFIQDHSPLVK